MIGWTIIAINWAFIGDALLVERSKFFNELKENFY